MVAYQQCEYVYPRESCNVFEQKALATGPRARRGRLMAVEGEFDELRQAKIGSRRMECRHLENGLKRE